MIWNHLPCAKEGAGLSRPFPSSALTRQQAVVDGAPVLKLSPPLRNTTMSTDPHESLREHILYLLNGGGAHLDLFTALYIWRNLASE